MIDDPFLVLLVVPSQCLIQENGLLFLQFHLGLLQLVTNQAEGQFFLLVDLAQFEQVAYAIAVVPRGVVQIGDETASRLFHLLLLLRLVALLHQLEAFLCMSVELPSRMSMYKYFRQEVIAPKSSFKSPDTPTEGAIADSTPFSTMRQYLFCLRLLIFLFQKQSHGRIGQGIFMERWKGGLEVAYNYVDDWCNDVIELTSMFEQQRTQATFSRKDLSVVIYGSAQQHENFLRKQALIDNDPVLRFDPAILHRSRAELINIYAKKLIRFSELFPQSLQMHSDKSLFFDEQFPLGLHDFMFLTTLRNLCDEQQRKTILEPAERGEILGCYAQTQLGHGSDVQSLMTTATYDPESQTFVLNTPEVQAAKWWIGDLGIFCTHACVFAQLIIKGKNHGVHAFVVPVRDQNHRPFPGIEVGDVGPKLGFNTKDNGYLIMKHYRIPRNMMLMKFHKVARDGTYSVSGNEKVSYATMLFIRSAIPYLAFAKTSKAITILTRYSLTRKQFKNSKGQEVPILDYQLQQEKIFPRISEVFANLFAFKTIYELANLVIEDASKNVFDRFQQAHIITSSVKAISTKDGLRGLEVLRRAGGGHAFSTYSGIPGLQTELAPTFTFEGEYTILQLQVARYLLKYIDRAIRSKSLAGSVAYLARFSEPVEPLDTDKEETLADPANIIRFFELNSLQRTKRAAQRLQQGMQKGMKLKNAWDQFSGLELVDAATAHGYYLMVKFYWDKVSELCKEPRLKEVLTTLFLLYAVDRISEYSLSFYETGVLGSTSLKTYREIREKLLAKIRPNALTIVEAFDYSDGNLHSAIGRSDGKAYETLLDWAMNKNDVNQPEHAEGIRQAALKLKEEAEKIMRAKL